MSGWTHEAMPPEGLVYEGVAPASRTDGAAGADDGGEAVWRTERYFGETGAQSSVVPALDAALGIGMSEDELLPYLLAMREYMPPEHAAFIDALERGPRLREAVRRANDDALTAAYDRCVSALVAFRKLHFELAFTYVRQWDSRKDDEIQGTGGTPARPLCRTCASTGAPPMRRSSTLGHAAARMRGRRPPREGRCARAGASAPCSRRRLLTPQPARPVEDGAFI